MVNENKIVIARFGSTHGIEGWIKVISFTEPYTNILNYSPWYILDKDKNWRVINPLESRITHQAVLVKLPDCHTPEQVRVYTNQEIAVERGQLPATKADEYYWTDLEGLTVINQENQILGKIDSLFNSGANDVIVVKGDKERLIPYIKHVIIEVNLAERILRVDWDADF